jgi:hypothetical protein
MDKLNAQIEEFAIEKQETVIAWMGLQAQLANA